MSDRGTALGNGELPETGITVPWSAEGIALFEVSGSDAKSALEAGLRAVVVLVNPEPADLGAARRSVPIHGDGADLAGLFADMVEDLFAQVEEFGSSLHDITVDGLLRRDGGGFVAWGYAQGALEPAPPVELPKLLPTPVVVDGGSGRVIIQGALRRP